MFVLCFVRFESLAGDVIYFVGVPGSNIFTRFCVPGVEALPECDSLV